MWSCASSGTNFVRPAEESIALGKTTPDQIYTRFGKPFRETTTIRDNNQIRTVTYTYSEAAPYVQKVPNRTMVFHFNSGVLVGYDFLSSFDEDKTDFDDTRATEIKKGETTQAQVIQIFGRPTGRHIYPLVKEREQRAVVYNYLRMEKPPMGGAPFQASRKLLVVTFNADDKVADVSLTVANKP
jgi:hypothetical protein